MRFVFFKKTYKYTEARGCHLAVNMVVPKRSSDGRALMHFFHTVYGPGFHLDYALGPSGSGVRDNFF